MNIPRWIALALAASGLAGRPLPSQEPDAPRPVRAARTSVGVDAGYVAFGDGTAAWTLGALSLRRQGTAGTLIGRVTLADRFGSTGVQVEADAYPRLSRTVYAYLNVGRSVDAIFPAWRYGGELYTALPGAYEASAGVRHLRFAGEPVTLFTGSVGKYAGNYWLSLRPYVRSHDGAVTGSGSLTLRRYGEHADDYLGLRVGGGTAPSELVTAADLARTRSTQAAVQGSHDVRRGLIGTWAIGVEREVLAVDRTRNRVELNAGARVDF